MRSMLIALSGLLSLAPVFLLSSCSGVSGGPELTTSSALLDFGEVSVGESAEAVLSVENDGDASAELGPPVIHGEDAEAFSVVGGDWPLALEPGESLDVTLLFSPTVSGVLTAEVEISSTGSGGLSGGADSSVSATTSVAVVLLGQGLSSGDDDDSAGDDDDDSTGDDDDDDTSSDDDDAGAGPDEDGDGHVAELAGGTDCDDTDPTVNPTSYEICDGIDNDCDGDIDDDPIDGSVWHLDSDSDGYGGQLLTQEACTAPASYVGNSDDCDDLIGAIYPGATELCNGIDDDCDGDIDDDAPAAQTWYLDNDGDGVGGFWLTQVACSMPQGYAGDSSDCDDTNAAIYPLAPELCDGSDNDCDGNLGGDEIDNDGDGVTECSQDCDDADPLRFPGSAELCDGIDNDCDAATTAVGGEIDADSDASLSCLDCDDDANTGPGVYPGASEVCDGVDNDCDGTVDVGATDETTWYLDADGDAHGGGWLTQQGCAAPAGYVANSDDCNDLDPTSYPGASELCDGQDNDCNNLIDDGAGAAGTTWYADTDADGYGDAGTVSTACSQPTGFVSNSLDCDDGNAATNPTSYEICDDVDNNCVDGVDEAGALNATNWYLDDDGDEYGVPGTPLSSCTQPTGYADNTADCNDDPNNGGAAINPDATELCNTVDDDCDGTVDDGAVDAPIWYVDADGDSYGNAGTGALSCTQLGGTVQDGTDCNDTELNVHPFALELCDSVDNDCDIVVDEDDALGTNSNCAANDCQDILDNHTIAPGDGAYWLDPDGAGAFQSYCDMTTNGGGWTLVANVAPVDGNVLGYTSDYWYAAAPYGSFGNRFSHDFKSPAAYRLQGTHLMIQSSDTGASGAIRGWKRWPFLSTQTFNALFFGGGQIPTSCSGAMYLCDTQNSDAADVGSTSQWDGIIRKGTCLYADVNTESNDDVSRLITHVSNGCVSNRMGGFGTYINGQAPGMDRGECGPAATSSWCSWDVCAEPGTESPDCGGGYCGQHICENHVSDFTWNSRFYVR